MAAASQQFCLRWNNHQSNFVSHFDSLLKDTLFTDVTLACEGQQIKAHRVVLTACSPYFLSLFKNNVNSTSSTIVLLSGVKFNDLRAIVDFIYKGEVNIGQGQLEGFLKTADSLKVKGLAEVNQSRGSLLTGDSAPAPPVITPPAQRATNAAPKTNSNDSSRSSPPPPKRKRKAASRPDNSDEDEYVPKTKVEMDTSTISSSESKTRKRNKSASASSAAASPDPAQEADDPADPPEPDPDIPPLKTECIELSDEEFDEGSEMDDTRMTGLDGTNDDSLAETSGLNASDAVATPGQASTLFGSIPAPCLIPISIPAPSLIPIPFPVRLIKREIKHFPRSKKDQHQGTFFTRNKKNFQFECGMCSKACTKKHNLFEHYRLRHLAPPHDVPWSCSQCVRQFAYKCELNKHLLGDHKISAGVDTCYLECPDCGAKHGKFDNYLEHIKSVHQVEECQSDDC